MAKTIKMNWHEVYLVLLMIGGVLRSLSWLGSCAVTSNYLNSGGITGYEFALLLTLILDLVVTVLMFIVRKSLRDFTPGAIGMHTAMLLLIMVSFAIGNTVTLQLQGNNIPYGILVSVIGALLWELPLWIYYHKRRRLYECSAAEREYLLYGTPMPQYTPRVLESNTFSTYQPQTPVQQPQVIQPPVQQPPVEQPKRQVVRVHKKGEAPKQPKQPEQPQRSRQEICFCRHCGRKLRPEAVYCPQCGIKIET